MKYVTKEGAKRWKKVFLAFFVLISIVLFGGCMFFRHYYNLLDVQIEEDATTITSEVLQVETEDTFLELEEIVKLEEKSNKETINIMLLGIDSRKDDYKGRTDTMILVSINPNTRKVLMTSFLRDTYVQIPGYGGNRLNSAYVFGGTSLLSETLFHL